MYNSLYSLDNEKAYNGFELLKVDPDRLQTAIQHSQHPNDLKFWDFLPRNRNQNQQSLQIQEQEVNKEEEIPLVR